MNSKKIVSIILSLIMVVSLFCSIGMITGNAATGLYTNSFGGTGYQGMNTDGEKTDFKTDKAYGTDYVLNTSINVSSITDGDGRGIKFMLRNTSAASSGKVELWIGKNKIWACTNQWKNMQDFNFVPYMNKSTAVKITVSGNEIKLALDGTEVWSCIDSTFSGTECPVAMGGWDAKYVINSLGLSSVGGDDPAPQLPKGVLYLNQFAGTGYQGMNADSDQTEFVTDKAYGTDYVLESKINLSNIKEGDGKGVKFVLRSCSSPANTPLELWIGKTRIWACTNQWVNSQDFNLVPYMNKETAVKITVSGNKVALSFDGTEVWSCEDAGFAGTESKITIGGWDAKYVVNELKLSEVGTPDPDPDPNPNPNPDPTPQLPDGVLYINDFDGTGYQGLNTDGEKTAFVTDKAYGTDYELVAKVNVSSIADGDGRGMKFALRKCSAASSGELELWIGKTAIWACADQWKNMQPFDFTPYLNKETTVKVTMSGNDIKLSLDGKEVWTCNDEIFAGAESKISLGGWDAKYIISQLKIAKVGTLAGGETGVSDSGTKLPAGVLYYNDFEGKGYQGMNTEGEKVEFYTDKTFGPDYILETSLHISSIGAGDGRGIKFILRNCAAASSGKLELWVGKKAIWACADQWKNMQEFDITPYLNKDVKVKLVVKGSTLSISMDGKEVWTCTDDSFAGCTASVVGLGSWDAVYTINNIKITDVNMPSTGDSTPLALILVLFTASSLVLLTSKKLLAR